MLFTELGQDTVRDVITMHAYTSGLEAGAYSSAVAAVGVFTANKYSKTFRTRLGHSGKTALIVSAFLTAFTLSAETRLVDGARNPQKYLASIDPNYIERKIEEHKQLQWWQKIANFVYDHPYKTLILAGTPLVGGIFAVQRTNTAIQRSQQIMHTRIYGQGAVVLLLLGSMAFHDLMAKRGRFVPEYDDEVEQQQ